MSAILLFALVTMQAPPAPASPLPPRDPSLPAPEETAKAALESSPRHGEYVDVGQLFQYAADQVPQLARHIGGIQKPLITAPRGTSFDVWTSAVVIVGYAIPGFLFAMLLIVLLAGGSFLSVFPLRGLLSPGWTHMSLAAKIGMRYNVRLPRDLKRRYCRKCHAFLVPGKNCRVRISRGKVTTTCGVCGDVRRIPYVRERAAKRAARQ